MPFIISLTLTACSGQKPVDQQTAQMQEDTKVCTKIAELPEIKQLMLRS